MARGKKTGGRDFEKGKPPGPGRPRMPINITNLRRMNRGYVDALISEFAMMTRDEIQERLKSAEASVIEVAIGSIFVSSVKEADPTRLNFLLDRAIGKVPNVNQNEDITERRKELEEVPREQISALLRAVGSED